MAILVCCIFGTDAAICRNSNFILFFENENVKRTPSKVGYISKIADIFNTAKKWPRLPWQFFFFSFFNVFYTWYKSLIYVYIFNKYLTKVICCPRGFLIFLVVDHCLSNCKRGNLNDHKRPLPVSLNDFLKVLTQPQLLEPRIKRMKISTFWFDRYFL